MQWTRNAKFKKKRPNKNNKSNPQSLLEDVSFQFFITKQIKENTLIEFQKF